MVKTFQPNKYEVCEACRYSPPRGTHRSVVMLNLIRDERRRTVECACDCGLTVLINSRDLENRDLVCQQGKPCKWKHLPVAKASGEMELTN